MLIYPLADLEMAKCCQWWSQGISRVFHLSIQASDSIFLTVHLPGGWKSMMWWSSAGNAGEDFFPRIGHSGKTDFLRERYASSFQVWTGVCRFTIKNDQKIILDPPNSWWKNIWSTKTSRKHNYFFKKNIRSTIRSPKLHKNYHTNLAEKWVKTTVFNGQPVPRWPRLPTVTTCSSTGAVRKFSRLRSKELARQCRWWKIVSCWREKLRISGKHRETYGNMVSWRGKKWDKDGKCLDLKSKAPKMGMSQGQIEVQTNQHRDCLPGLKERKV